MANTEFTASLEPSADDRSSNQTQDSTDHYLRNEAYQLTSLRKEPILCPDQSSAFFSDLLPKSNFEKTKVLLSEACKAVLPAMLDADFGVHYLTLPIPRKEHADITEPYKANIPVPLILESAAVAAAIGFCSRTLLPRTGILGRVGEVVLAATFTAPLLADCYNIYRDIICANSLTDLRYAGQRIGAVTGNLVANLPVGIASYKAGSFAGDKFIKSKAIAPFAERLLEKNQLRDLNKQTEDELYSARELERNSGLANSELDERTRQLALKIEQKFKQPVITEEQLARIVESFPASEHGIALQLLARSLPYSSEVLFAEQMKSLRKNLESALKDSQDTLAYIATGQASWGQAFSYLYKKLSRLENRIYTNTAESLALKGKSAVLFDDLSTAEYSSSQREAFLKFHRLYVLDLSGFEKGLNFFDFALGEGAVKEKLTKLVDRTKSISRERPGLSPNERFDLLLREDVLARAKLLNSNAILVKPESLGLNEISTLGTAWFQQRRFSGAELSKCIGELSAAINTPKATQEKISKFLKQFVPRNREPVAFVIADGADNITYKQMFDLSRNIHSQLLESAMEKGLSQADLIFQESEGNSSYLINYMHRIANKIPGKQFMAQNAITDLANKNELGNRAIVFLDDASYTGSQLDGRISAAVGADKARLLMAGVLAKYQFPAFCRENSRVLFIAGKNKASYLPHIWEGARQEQFDKAVSLAGDSGFYVGVWNDPRVDFMGPVISADATLVWPYGIPDNNISILRRFAGDVLGLRQVADLETVPLPLEFKTTSNCKMFSWSNASFLRNGALTPLSYSGKDVLQVKVTDRNRSHTAQAYISSRANCRDGYGLKYAEQYTALDTLRKTLGLSTGNSPLLERSLSEIKGELQAFVREDGIGEELLEGLLRISKNNFVTPLNTKFRKYEPEIPAIMRIPTTRLQVERAMLERLVFLPNDRRPLTRLITKSDGTTDVINECIDRIDGESKPSWSSIDYRLAREFSGTELTPTTYDALQRFYNSHGNVAEVSRLTNGVLKGECSRELIYRIEWFLENKRFPGHNENSSSIY